VAKDYYLLSGLHIEGATLDENNQLRELRPSEALVQTLPLIVLRTMIDKLDKTEVIEEVSSLCTDSEDSQGSRSFYECPIYKTRARLQTDVEPVGYIKLQSSGK